jgi:predicted nucleotide-binding protein
MTIVQDLFELADAADEAQRILGNDDIQKSLSAIRTVAREAERAWSGSNIGYHATVYFEGLNPAPPEAQFSSEWGLMRRWPTHEPHPGWCIMDFQVVLDALRVRAGRVDLKLINEELQPIRGRFLSLKERAISLLTAAIAKTADAFIDRKLKQIEVLSAPDASHIARDLLPHGQYWTRDSQAMSQGLKLAPHQTLAAIGLSATALKNALDTLANATREAASHIQRPTRREANTAAIRTNVFIGHGRSPVWRELKDFIEARLQLAVDEFNSVPVAGISTAARLSDLLDTASFAFLIMTAEDDQPDGKVRARENVVHEVGLFQGRIGFTRAIVLIEEGCQEFSNIHGLGQIRFPKGNISAKFEDVRAVLEREELI